MNSVVNTTATTADAALTLSDIGFEMVECWEDLIDEIEEIEEPTAPTKAPLSPEPVLKETVSATMEIVKVSVTRTKPPKKAKTQKVPSPRRKKVKGRKMTLQEYYAECERKEQELLAAQEEAERKAKEEAERIAKENAPSKKALRRKRAKAAKKAREAAQWKAIEKKPEPKRAHISYPQGWSKSLYKETPVAKGRFVNTTLILKNLPYEGTTERDLKRFFSATCGPVRFVNVLRQDDGRCKGIAFVRFEKKVGSDRGLTLNGFWYEDRKVYVEYAEDRRKK